MVDLPAVIREGLSAFSRDRDLKDLRRAYVGAIKSGKSPTEILIKFNRRYQYLLASRCHNSVSPSLVAV